MYHDFMCNFDLALTYASRRPKLARACCVDAMIAAIRMGRPDLTYRANALLGVL